MVTPEALIDAAGRATRRAILLDFDGTIADIVPVPRAARPLPGVSELLASLATPVTTVAVISSRPVSFLLHVLGDVAPPVRLFGLGGIESYEDGRIGVAREAEPWVAAVRAAVALAPTVLPGAAEIEDKGLSFTVHYRDHPDLAAQVREACTSLAAQTGLRTRPGKLAVEVGMPIAVDKGTTVRRIGEGHDWLLFAGDDSVDIDGFTALHQLAVARPGVRAFAVAVLSDEAPPDLVAGADLTVEGPRGLRDLLTRLDRALTAPAG